MKRTVIAFILFKAFLIFMSSAEAKAEEVENKMSSRHKWYEMLPDEFKPIEENKIELLEKLRVKQRATHEELVFSIMSTPWAVEKAQYGSLREARRLNPDASRSERDLWRIVLYARFETMKKTLDIEIHEYSKLTRKELSERTKKLMDNIDLVIVKFSSFEDLIKFVICMEKEMGNFDYPPGALKVLNELNLILGRGIPSKEESNWYMTIINEIIQRRKSTKS